MEYKYKSKEEEFFALWLDELCKHGFIVEYVYEPKPIILSDKVERSVNVKGKLATQFVLHPHEYTYDFEILWETKAIGIFATQFEVEQKSQTPLYCDAQYVSYIEIKPEFDFKNMTREVMINLKWVYEKHKIFVNLVKIPSFFKKSFTPYKFLQNKNGTMKKIKYTPILKFAQFLSNALAKTNREIQVSVEGCIANVKLIDKHSHLVFPGEIELEVKFNYDVNEYQTGDGITTPIEFWKNITVDIEEVTHLGMEITLESKTLHSIEELIIEEIKNK